ncbi:glycoside hydrolase family 3 C-terminal domain-containing protein [Actinomadura barringtoniae]|uniref:Glycoside hydrolase family 3 C-terminal domain-containing protein n=1 Tax=Actinomadura barringtoniae TaxID=1427535 RepID=A0A939PDL3_9ACTN|nr:beta-glucosidase [Actinomadura barringtoniae]MBO2450665.1 glycoside hydrolase family 3 C-terminal domain-containing protein [Actinomadura barringtoniae]
MHRRPVLLALVLSASFFTAPHGASAAPGCSGEPWMDHSKPAAQRVAALLPRMTIDEKVSMTASLSNDTYARETLPIPRLCIPALRLNNGPAGVGSGGPVQPQTTAMPAPLGMAASFDPEVARAYGYVLGRETRDTGRNLSEGPDVDIARVPLNGRTFEAFGEDPYLSGRIVTGEVRGVQSQGVISEPKHFVGNSQETDRNTIDEKIDERTLRQIYLKPYEMSLKAEPGAVMCAKNLVNGAHACEHKVLQQGVLKNEWGFDGFVVSDFSSCYDTVRCAEGGLDFELPAGKYYGAALKTAVEAGKVSQANLDDHVSRVLTSMFRLGIFDRAQITRPIDVKGDGAIARHVAEEATVLLKNRGGVLPLRKNRSVALIGASSRTAVATGGGSAGVAPTYKVSPLEAFQARGVKVTQSQGMPPVELGPQPAVPTYALKSEDGRPGLTARYFKNPNWTGDPAVTRVDPWIAMDPSGGPPDVPGFPADGWSIRWNGTLTAPADGDYVLHLTNYRSASLYLDGTKLLSSGGGFPSSTTSATVHLTKGESHQFRVDWSKPTGQAMISVAWTPPASLVDPQIAEAAEAARHTDTAVVFAADKDTEGRDRPGLALPGHQDQLIEAVAKANPHTVVVLNTGGPVLMPWLDKVAGVVQAWYPGQEHGNAAASVLLGEKDPAGRLPITFPKSLADTPASTPAQYPGVNGVATFSEGLGVGYRHYDAKGIAPLFPFGYGLSYTSFRLSRLNVHGDRVSVDVANTGSRRGSEVVQVYVGGADGRDAGAPPRRLAGIAKVSLAPGEHRRVTLSLDDRPFAHWDEASHAWVTPHGTYTVSAGTSSRDLPLTVSVRK